jgi:NAD(P)-dependent dehydrogenase (short-subunit alcohol dehydrogenase family)
MPQQAESLDPEQIERREMKLERKVALITGGSTGIGEAIVRLYSAEGARVLFVGRRREPGERLENELRTEGREVRFVSCDVRDEGNVMRLIADTTELHGRLDIVVNNAGIAPASPVETMELSVWEELMACNVRTMFLVSKHAIPELRKTKGCVINLGSTFGIVGAAGSAGYALTKAAAVNFSKSLALELAPDGIRVNALCPGGTRTEFLQAWFESTGDAAGTEKWLVEHHPLGRLGTPLDQARAALFLASEEASFITGHALLVDGGYTAQ